MRDLAWLFSSITGIGFSVLVLSQPVARAASADGYVDILRPHAERIRVVAELQSGDSGRVAAAMEEIRTCALMKGHPNGWDLQLLVQAGRSDDAEKLAVEGMIQYAHSDDAIAQFELARVRAFAAAGKGPEAEGAAKGYYNLVRLKDTSKAITAVSDILSSSHPDDPQIANRFKAQQLTDADSGGSSPTTRPALGAPILAGVHIDSTPFDQAIKDRSGATYIDMTAKGNLLLAADQAKEAHATFQAALKLAGSMDLPLAVENMARAIRAETGAIGPANAYLASLAKQQP